MALFSNVKMYIEQTTTLFQIYNRYQNRGRGRLFTSPNQKQNSRLYLICCEDVTMVNVTMITDSVYYILYF